VQVLTQKCRVSDFCDRRWQPEDEGMFRVVSRIRKSLPTKDGVGRMTEILMR
jgi:hypothetical protein